MPKETAHDPEFETRFYESVLRRYATYTNVIEILGALYTRQGRIAEGLKMDRRLVKLQPESPTARYNLACSLALARRRNHAIDELRKAIELGYHDVDWMLKDPDLESLKDHPHFDSLLAELKPQS